jgi:hypothetical protein
MKRIIALVIVILGLAAILVPTAGAKARGGGGVVCTCDPITATS